MMFWLNMTCAWLAVASAMFPRKTIEVVREEENVIYVRAVPHRCSA